MPDKNKIILGTNDDTYIAADDAGNIVLQHEQGQRVALTNTSIEPATDETLDLGSATNKFKDLYLSSDSIFIGNTKLSSDPATGALSTVVADEQGQFTAPAAPVGGGGGKGYDWKGSTTNYAKDDPKMSQSSDNANGLYSSRTSMEHLYNKMVVYGAGQQADATDMIEVFWGHYLGNPNATAGAGAQSPSYGLPIDFSTGTTSAMSIFVTDENGDDLSKFLVDYMDENNLQLVNFEFSLSARLQVQDPVKAATIPYFQAGQFNNATNVTSIPLWTMTQGYMYAFKCATNNHYGHTRGIVMGSMGLSTAYDSTLSQGFNNDGDRFALNTLGSTSNQWSQPNAFLYNNLQENSARINSQLALHIDMNLNNPMAYMQSTDPNFTTPESYFDINDGIVFDMLVHIR